jgi:hypothetical protein
LNEPNFPSFGIGFLAGYLNQAGRNFFAHAAHAEQACGQVDKGNLFPSKHEAWHRRAVCRGKETFSGFTPAMFVPSDGMRRHCQYFRAHNDFF